MSPLPEQRHSEFSGDAPANAMTDVTHPYRETSFSGAGAVVAEDHGALGGLGDDDHPQYTRADGTRAFTGPQSMGSQKLTNLADAAADGDAVSRLFGDGRWLALGNAWNYPKEPEWFVAGNVTGVITLTSGTVFLHYLGRADKAYTRIDVRFRVTTAASTITWAELAVYKGTLSGFAGTITAVRLGVSDISGVVNSTGLKTVTVTLTGVAAGDDLWIAFGNSATVPASLRAGLEENLQSGVMQTHTTQPSTASSVATTLAGAAQVPAWFMVLAT